MDQVTQQLADVVAALSQASPQVCDFCQRSVRRDQLECVGGACWCSPCVQQIAAMPLPADSDVFRYLDQAGGA